MLRDTPCHLLFPNICRQSLQRSSHKKVTKSYAFDNTKAVLILHGNAHDHSIQNFSPAMGTKLPEKSAFYVAILFDCMQKSDFKILVFN